MRYHENATSSVFAEDGSERAEFRPLDEVLGEAPVTLVKMDIEGAEPLALRGAERIIREHAPKLAICTYHRAEHLWEIPALIREMNPAYRFYFRHHDTDETETVCYAII
ncbi:FkbM family methyltransferase [Selenomonas sp. oral taxon 137]|uniref:FkbM family methyltransferase n=1 Tax=Selenomonas sp. oral taxon 137 TaxID=712531 RepID=UPI0006812160